MLDTYRAIGPLLRALPAEPAHRLTIHALKAGQVLPLDLLRRRPADADSRLTVQRWGLAFTNPIGLAAGFDKNAEVVDAMLSLGFGFVEIGSVTPRPQSGNPKPRLFRLSEDQAIINRMGFNNDGLAVVGRRLTRARRRGVVGVNLGRNKETEDPIGDYVQGVLALGPLADYLVINVSSPNTPGLRALQGRDSLVALIDRLGQALARLTPPPPLILKIAPDLEADALSDIAKVASRGILAGLIVSNTTTARPGDLRSPHAGESGGLSGRPLFEPSTEILRALYRLTEGKIPLVGVGGIASADDAYAKIRAGASLVQLYSALVYQGPALLGRLKRGLLERLHRDGYTDVGQAVGADHR